MKNKLSIVKIGGNVLADEILLNAFLSDFSALRGPKILVHGGGKKASEFSKQVGLEPKMHEGRRITDAASLEIITMVYGGYYNKNIVARLQAYNCNAIGMSGADGNTIQAHKRTVKDVDYGFAGDVDGIHPDTLKGLLELDLIPVFCAITHDQKGQLLNTNADTIASELAIGMSSHYLTTLYYCFEKNGVLLDIEDPDSVITNINTTRYKELLKEGSIADGMLPKMKNCFHALQNGVSRVCIGSPEMIRPEIKLFTSLSL